MIQKALKSNLFKNFSSLALIQAGNYLIPLLIVPYISRIIGLEHYGNLEYSRTIALYFTIIIDYGFNLTATREVSLNRHDKNKLNRIVTNTYFAKFILFIISSLLFAFLLGFKASFHDIKLLLGVTFLINIGNLLFPIWFFQGIEKIASIAYINFGIKLIVLLSVFIFIKVESDFWKYNFILSIAQILIGIFTIYTIFWKYKIKLLKFEYSQILKKFKTGFSVFSTTILVAVFVTYAFILLKETGTKSDVGAYSTANKLAIIVQSLIVLPFSQVFFPFLSKKASESIVEFESLINKSSIVILLITLIIGIVSFVFASFIIETIFGKKFLYAVDTFKILAFLPVFTILNNLFSYQGLLSLKKDKLFLYIHIVFTILIVGASYLLVPKLGLKGTAYIRIISEILLMTTSYTYLKRAIKSIKHE